MGIFDRLWQLRQLEQHHLPFLRTNEDRDLVLLIGMHQAKGTPITMKRIIAAEIGAIATLQRRVARLKRLGVIIPTPQESDKRNVTLELGARAQRAFHRLDKLLEAESLPAAREPQD